MKTFALILSLLLAGFASAQTPKPKTFFVEELTVQEYKDYSKVKKQLDDAKANEAAAYNSVRSSYGDNYVKFSGFISATNISQIYKYVEIRGDYALITTSKDVTDPEGSSVLDFSVKELSPANKRIIECVEEELVKAKANFDKVEQIIKTSHGETKHFSNGMIQLAVCWYGETTVEIRGKYALITTDQTKSNCGGSGVIIGTPPGNITYN